MGRVRDVVFAAGDGFDGRPAEAMPHEIQSPDGNPPIDDPHAGQLGGQLGGWTILPGTGEDRDIVAAGARQRAGDVMDVFTDARAGPQGGTVIDDDPHAAEPITSPSYPCWSTGWKDVRFVLKSKPFGLFSERSQ